MVSKVLNTIKTKEKYPNKDKNPNQVSQLDDEYKRFVEKI